MFSIMMVLLWCAFVMFASVSVVVGKSPPNILFLMADEMDGRVLDDESPEVRPPMPNLRKLAASGAIIVTAYSESPQCVPSRSSMMTGRRTDEIRVYDNFVGVVAVDGDPTEIDEYCLSTFGEFACKNFAKFQQAPRTWIDELAASGYNISLYGKMHVGAGLSRYPGLIQEFPFQYNSPKAWREWMRGVGSITNTKGLEAQLPHLNVPDNVSFPAPDVDYAAINSCVTALEEGLFTSSTPNLLYCSIIVPHPPYKSNATYMAAVKDLNISIALQVPLEELHPNDKFTAILKRSLFMEQVSPAVLKHFREVYFSMCFESDSLLGKVIDSLDASGAREKTYIMMVSDHGEDNTEHRQTGKNNMYDSGSRVMMLLSGPGIKPNQVITDILGSLNDVFPTVLDFAGIKIPDGLAGHSLLDIVGPQSPERAIAARKRPDFIVAQYHSVFSLTGEFMIRQGRYKLILFGPMLFEDNWPPQLFDLEADKWELHNIAAQEPEVVMRLTKLLESALGNQSIATIDNEAKSFQKSLFVDWVYDKHGGATGCLKFNKNLYGANFNISDSERVEKWLQRPCPFPSPDPDPNCKRGIFDSEKKVCCSISCETCAHPYHACKNRPGGAQSCCPSIILKRNQSCNNFAAPCAIKESN